MHLYYADPHLGHKNIIAYAQRPFVSLEEMNEFILNNIEEEAIYSEAKTVYCLGDFAWNEAVIAANEKWIAGLNKEWRHVLIAGNHDNPIEKPQYRYLFANIVGSTSTWRNNTLIVEDVDAKGKPVKLLLSHEPQRDFQGCDYNLYGHHHNNIVRNSHRKPDGTWAYNEPHEYFANYYPWLLNDDRYFNVGVELIGYIPRSFSHLQAMRQLGARLV